MIKLTPEQTEEVFRHPDGVECQADGSDQMFVIVDASILRRMRSALYTKEMHASIAAGIADMEVGRMMTAQEADAYVRVECGFPAPNES